MDSIGRTVQRLRSERGWDQSALARRAKVSPSTISRLENGKLPNPSAAVLGKIATVFNLRVEDLTQGPKTPLSEATRERLEKALNRPGVETRFASLLDRLDDLSDEEAVQLLDAINQMTEIGRRRAGM